jgi:hypothetical protein
VAVVGLVVLTGSVAAASALTAPTSPTPARARSALTTVPSPLGITVPSLPNPTTTPTTPGPAEGIQRVVFIDPNHGYGLFLEREGGSCGLSVASTSDAGVTFSPRVPVAPSQCYTTASTSLAFDGYGDGFVYGPVLYATHDGGRSWLPVQGIGSVVGLALVGTSVWAAEQTCPSSDPAAQCGLKLDRSTDGGRTWSGQVLPNVLAPPDVPGSGDQEYTILTRTSQRVAYLLVPPPLDSPTPTTSVTVLTTLDGGSTWTSGSAPCIGGFGTLLSVAPNGVVWLACATQPGAGQQLKTVVRSLDGGRTWTEAPCGMSTTTTSTWPNCLQNNTLESGYLGDIAATSSTTAFIDGGRNFVQVTHDGGLSWSVTSPPVGDGDSTVGGLYFANPSDGWVITRDGTLGGTLWRTTDGGTKWSQIWTASS